ncbi:MAG: hypothetical protein IIB28_02145, partial [Chloroflexi bacterium]|nr:hypothetical protein [Chloroflexota bacterium]
MSEDGLTKDQLEKALSFEGYGRKSAPYWFLGMEEGGGSVEELIERVNLFDSIEDLYSAHTKLGLEETMHRHVPTWRVMSKLVMAMQGTPNWQDTASARDYQATRLGREDGDTFLVELMPLPSPSTAVWPYESIYATREEYYLDVRPKRIEWLRSELSIFQPSFVICYGKGNWRFHQEIFHDVDFIEQLDGKIRVGAGEKST